MYLAELCSPTVAALPRSTPIVFPIAAMEQHGPHLPLYTDSLLLGEIVRRAEIQMHDKVVFAPLQWLGNSDHHLDFPGTLSAPPRVYLELLVGMAENVIRHGFQRLFFLNGHGGNDVPGRQAIFELRQTYRDRHDLLLLMATYWHLGDPLKDAHIPFVQPHMGHACEWETSMILSLAPHLVRDTTRLSAVDATPAFHPAFRGWTTRERSVSGYLGAPSVSRAEKGEHLFQVFTAGTVQLLERVREWNGSTWLE